jgi:cell wall-associated NlpC family hydrolase
MQREPFEEWLAGTARATSNRSPETPGVVMVWRDASGQAEHAAVTLGSGWALHKPSQGWMSPSTVLRTSALIRSVRVNGLRMERYLLHDPV